MSSVTGPNLGMLHSWATGEDGWNAGMDGNLKKLDAIVQVSVKDKDLNAPPGSPANGDRYIVGPAPTGGWATHAGEIAAFDGPSALWVFYPAKRGWLVYVEDEDVHYLRGAASWALWGKPVALTGTRSLWIPPTEFGGDGVPTVVGTFPMELNGYAYVPFSGSADFHDYLNFIIPRDFGGVSACALLIANGGGTSSANTRWQLGLQHVLDGEQADAGLSHAETTIAPYGIQHQIKEAALTVPALALVKGDVIRLMLARLATDGADTNPDEMRVLGLRFDYAWAP